MHKIFHSDWVESQNLFFRICYKLSDSLEYLYKLESYQDLLRKFIKRHAFKIGLVSIMKKALQSFGSHSAIMSAHQSWNGAMIALYTKTMKMNSFGTDWRNCVRIKLADVLSAKLKSFRPQCSVEHYCNFTFKTH